MSGDNAWQRVLRATQSTWRASQGLPAADIEVAGATRSLGSRLTAAAGDEGSNFLTEHIWARVQAELAANADATGVDRRVIEPDRLKTNLLSSQPLCFNAFAELDIDRSLATRALRLLWPRLIGRVTSIEFEWSPGRGKADYLGNHSAFDVAIFYRDPSGEPGVIGIEAKYHENLRSHGGEIRERAREVARAAGIDVEADDAWRRAPLNQLLLDQLLACAIDQHPGRPWGRAHFALLFPAINQACRSAVADYQARVEATPALLAVTLEELIACLRATSAATWISELQRRYLGYERSFDVGQGIERAPRVG